MANLIREKRKYFRHPINAPIKLEDNRLKSSIQTESKDLSLGGLSFLWRRRLAKGDLLSLTLRVKEKPFEISGRVAYCVEDRKTGKYRTGVAFLDAPSAFRAKLAEEALEILQYRKELSRQTGREVTEEEAAGAWIKKFAGQFK